MSAKSTKARKTSASPLPRTDLIGLAAVLFLAIPTVEIARSLSAHFYYVNHALWVHQSTMRGLRNACWAMAAAALVYAPFRLGLARFLDEQSTMSSALRRALPAAACISFTSLIIFLKLCQHRGFQLPVDSAAMTQMVYNTLHGRWLNIGAFGTNALGVHFAFFTAVLAPALLVWNDIRVMLILQSLAIGSLGWAVYELIWDMTASSFASFLGLLLCFAHPFFYNMSAASVDNSLFEAPLFLWAMLCWRKKRLVWCAALMLLALTTREQFPFTLAGLGLYYAVRGGKPTSRSLLIGFGAAAASALVWVLEMHVVRSFQSKIGASYWQLYSHFGSTPEEVLRTILLHPLRTVIEAVYPFSRLWPSVRSVLYLALIPLAAPLQLIPWLVSGAPMLLMLSGIQHDLTAHYAAMVFGPLLFASAYGIAELYRRLDSLERRSFLLVPVLAAAGAGFWHSPSLLIPNWQLDWFHVVPQVLEKIPPRAAVWTEEFTTSWLACRLQLKFVPWDHSDFFEQELFRPEYVIVRKPWIMGAKPEFRDSVLTFLAREGYVKILDRAVPGSILSDPENRFGKPADRADLIILRDPSGPRAPGASPPLTLSPGDPALAAAYAHALLEGPVVP